VSDRLARRFEQTYQEGRAALVTFITGGDPDPAVSAQVLAALPGAGADIIEIGVPFTDPMADGPAIQAANLRALAAGATLRGILAQVRAFRTGDQATPIVLMGYLNPILSYGVDAFVGDARSAGVDGLIVVDLPPEEDAELGPQARAAGLHLIRLATPTTDDNRARTVVNGASGFLYYVSVAGITGAGSGDPAAIAHAVERLRAASGLPIAVGFGIRTPDQAAAMARVADGVVVGSALVNVLGEGDPATAATRVAALVAALSAAVRAAGSRSA